MGKKKNNLRVNQSIVMGILSFLATVSILKDIDDWMTPLSFTMVVGVLFLWAMVLPWIFEEL